MSLTLAEVFHSFSLFGKVSPDIHLVPSALSQNEMQFSPEDVLGWIDSFGSPPISSKKHQNRVSHRYKTG